MYIDHRQSNQLEQLATAKFTFNNKVYIVIKALPFKVNYGQELRISFEIRKKGKHVKAEEFVKKMKKIYEKAKAVLKKSQEKIKIYIDRNRKEAVKYKMEDRMLLSTRNLMWQMRNREMKKLTEKFMESYKIKKIISENMIKLKLPASMKIHPVVNVSRITMYQEQIEGQKKISFFSVEIDREKKYKIKKILNRRDVRRNSKYLDR